MRPDGSPMRALVIYATAHGSTRGIAERIANRLVGAGFEVDVEPVGATVDIATYDLLVVGSAIHTQAWLPEAMRFLRENAAALAGRPVWLFSVSSVGEESSFFGRRVSGFLASRRRDLASVAEARRLTRARGHHDFAGAISKGDWSWAGGLALRLLGGKYGDHRNWAEVDAWADGIANALSGAPAPLRPERGPASPPNAPAPLPGPR